MTSHLLLAVSTGIHQFHSLFEGIKTTDIQHHLRKCRWINITECNSHATSSDPAMKELMVNPAFVAYCISATTDLIGIHKSFNHFYVATKIITSLPHPTTVILNLFPEEWYHTLVWPLAPITFGRCGSNGIPISSIL